MISINKVILVGNVTKDPELKSTPSGTKVCSFSIATNRTFKDADGSKKEEAEFHNIVLFGKQAENTAQYMKKGSQIMIEGRIRTRSWDKEDGTKAYRTEIVGDVVQFGSKPQGDATPKANGSQEPVDEEDIPF